ncbi:hypothetical protein EZM77_22810 [Salmonella enterica subsp. enterica]|nr:hypothetical protein [Salmonella enterica]EAW2102961.1 hypothetical protein [Salmonella enterica subsp. enterica]
MFLSVGEHSPEEDKSAGSGFERCAATARRVAGRAPAINCRTSNKAKGPIERLGLFAFISLWKSYRLMVPTRFKHFRRVDKNRFSKRDFPPYIRLNHRM